MALTINQLFGTLQESITEEWRKHLQTHKYSKHKALNEYYEEMPEKVDALIEAWQADNDIVEDYECIIDASKHNALSYLKELKKIVKEGRKIFFKGETELESLTDDILALIDSTIYKVSKLTESYRSLSEYLLESVSANLVPATLQVRLDKLGLGDIQIKQKNSKYLYLTSDVPKWAKVLKKADNNLIKAKSYDDHTEDEWIDIINDIIVNIN